MFVGGEQPPFKNHPSPSVAISNGLTGHSKIIKSLLQVMALSTVKRKKKKQHTVLFSKLIEKLSYFLNV